MVEQLTQRKSNVGDEPDAAHVNSVVSRTAELKELSQRGAVSRLNDSVRSTLETMFKGSRSPPETKQPPPDAPRPAPKRPPPRPVPPKLLWKRGNAGDVRGAGGGNEECNGTGNGGGDAAGAMPKQWWWLPWMSTGVAVIALLIAPLVAVLMRPEPQGMPTWPLPKESGVDVNELLRTNTEVFSSALKDSIGRADQAVADRERLAAELEQCQRDLTQRDEYLKKAAPEVQKLRDQLREAQDTLIRVEAYFGAAAMAEAQRQRGWLQRALALGADYIRPRAQPLQIAG